MSDDLVKMLRVPCFEKGLDEGWIDHERKEAADRIEELEAKLAAKECPLGDNCDLTGAFMAGAAEFEVQNKQLRAELEKIKMMAARAFYDGMISTARATLAALKGEDRR